MKKQSKAFQDFRLAVQGWAFSGDRLPRYIEAGSCAAEKLTVPHEQHYAAETLRAMKEAFRAESSPTLSSSVGEAPVGQTPEV